MMPVLNVSVTVSSEVAAAVNEWRSAQLDENGTPKYASNGVLAKSILKDALRRILQSTPTSSMEAELGKKRAADDAIENIKNTEVS